MRDDRDIFEADFTSRQDSIDAAAPPPSLRVTLVLAGLGVFGVACFVMTAFRSAGWL